MRDKVFGRCSIAPYGGSEPTGSANNKEHTMKTLISASIVTLGLFTATAQAAPKDIWTELNETAPRSTFTDLNDTAPKSTFEQLNDTAPRSDGVYGELEKNAP
jgi:hypothetical protein